MVFAKVGECHQQVVGIAKARYRLYDLAALIQKDEARIADPATHQFGCQAMVAHIALADVLVGLSLVDHGFAVLSTKANWYKQLVDALRYRS